jgi:hypothetical protein
LNVAFAPEGGDEVTRGLLGVLVLGTEQLRLDGEGREQQAFGFLEAPDALEDVADRDMSRACAIGWSVSSLSMRHPHKILKHRLIGSAEDCPSSLTDEAI